MIILIGSSASGKTEIANTLNQKFGITKSVTTTTRFMRKNEIQNVHYNFVSKEKFLQMLNSDKFVESTQYQSNYYGLEKKEVKINGRSILDISGANKLIKIVSDDIFVCYISSSKNIRKERMVKRGDDPEVIDIRIESDNSLFDVSKLKKVNHVVLNENRDLLNVSKEIFNEYKKWRKRRLK